MRTRERSPWQTFLLPEPIWLSTLKTRPRDDAEEVIADLKFKVCSVILWSNKISSDRIKEL